MRVVIAFGVSLLVLLFLIGVAGAQAPIVTIRLAKDQIATVKTAPGITTRLVFLDQVNEIICGDLYDPASGRGSFVIQRGGKDVFLKPVATKGLSNMFVKTGQNDESVYSFDLVIVTADQAYRIVNVLDTQGVPVVRPKVSPPAVRITPPITQSMSMPDWKVVGFSGEIALGLAALPGITDDPEPPPPQEFSPAPTPTQRSAKRVPIQGDPTKRVKATYPEFAKTVGLYGEVGVEIVVDEKGKVISATAFSGPALLRQSAVNAARGWRFAPTKVAGVPTQAVGTITFRFERFADDRDGRVRANGGVQDSNSGDANGRRP